MGLKAAPNASEPTGNSARAAQALSPCDGHGMGALDHAGLLPGKALGPSGDTQRELGASDGPTLSGIYKLMALWHLSSVPRRRSHLPPSPIEPRIPGNLSFSAANRTFKLTVSFC